MLLTFQYPVIDARSFINDETGHFNLVQGPLGKYDFLRNFGALNRRANLWVDIQKDERIYSHANKAIRFNPPGPSVLGIKPYHINPKYFERKCYVNNYGCRIEISLADNKLNLAKTFVDEEILNDVLEDVFTTKVIIPGETNPTDVVNSGNKLAKLYLNASTKYSINNRMEPQEFWVNASDPMLLMVYDGGNYNLITNSFIELECQEEWYQLYYANVWFQNNRIGCWIINARQLYKRDRSDYIRKLRTNLLRCHVERETIKRILWLIKVRNLILLRGTDTSNKIQDFLNYSIGKMMKPSRFGICNTDIVQVVNYYDSLVNQEERDDLLYAIIDTRKNVFDKVSKITEKEGSSQMNSQGGIHFHNSGNFYVGNVTQTNVSGDSWEGILQQMEQVLSNEIISQKEELLEEIKTLRTELNRTKPSSTTVERILSNLGSIASIASWADKLKELLAPLLSGFIG